MSEPMETAEIEAFTKAADARSLSRAASELGVPRATLSRRLARLEERLGVRLLRRTTRSVTLTDAGEAFHRHARLVLDAVEQAEASVSRSDTVVRGLLRVSIPPIANASLHAMICAFAKKHPAVQLQVHATTEFVDLQRGGYDLALRAGIQLDPGLVARTLVRSALVAVASKAYLEEHGTPRSARDLRKHYLLLGFARGELRQTHWPLVDGGRIHVVGQFSSNELFLVRDAVLEGMGIALLPLELVGPLVQSGKLLHVLPGIVGAASQLSIVYLEREFVPPQVRAFVDAVVAWAPAGLGPALSGECVERALRKTSATKRKPKARTL